MRSAAMLDATTLFARADTPVRAGGACTHIQCTACSQAGAADPRLLAPLSAAPSVNVPLTSCHPCSYKRALTAKRATREDMPDLSEEQQAELFETIDRIRKAGCAAEVDVHGWNVTYTLRGGSKGKSRGAPRGDLTVVDPRDGSKIFSAVALQRKLMGVEEEKPMENVSTSQGNGPSARESIPDTLISSTGRSRRSEQDTLQPFRSKTNAKPLHDAKEARPD
eukprot:5083209-Pleurochrysis_carterae.AAC.1